MWNCLLTFVQSDSGVSIIKHSASRALIIHQLFMLNVIRLFKTLNLKKYPFLITPSFVSSVFDFKLIVSWYLCWKFIECVCQTKRSFQTSCGNVKHCLTWASAQKGKQDRKNILSLLQPIMPSVWNLNSRYVFVYEKM